jgi:hypothetical protein
MFEMNSVRWTIDCDSIERTQIFASHDERFVLRRD